MKKKKGTIRTFIFTSLKMFANVSLPLQKHHQGIQHSAINYITWNFLEYTEKNGYQNQLLRFVKYASAILLVSTTIFLLVLLSQLLSQELG